MLLLLLLVEQSESEAVLLDTDEDLDILLTIPSSSPSFFDAEQRVVLNDEKPSNEESE